MLLGPYFGFHFILMVASQEPIRYYLHAPCTIF